MFRILCVWVDFAALFLCAILLAILITCVIVLASPIILIGGLIGIIKAEI